MPKRALLAFAAVPVIMSLGFPATASAHNIDLAKTVAELKPYVQRVVDDPKYPYVSANTHCRKKFTGHSHYAICNITYRTAADPNACRERIQARIENRSFSSRIHKKHISAPCGGSRLLDSGEFA